jgi:hypothetical protein
LCSALSLLADLLEELGKMTLLILEELNLVLSLLGFNLLSLSISLLDGLDFRLQFRYFVFQLSLFMLELLDGLLEVSLSVLSLELLPHGEGHGGLIQGLVSGDGHLNLVTDSQQEQTSLGLGEGHLSDDLIEAL